MGFDNSDLSINLVSKVSFIRYIFMIVTVIGLGAVGGFYGAAFAKAGHHLRAVVRRGAEAIRATGLKVKSAQGWSCTVSCDAQESLSAWDSQARPDLVLVATKTTANLEVRQLLLETCGPSSQIVVLQNGLDVETDFDGVVPKEQLHAGLCFICSHLLSPGQVSHLDYGQVVLAPWVKEGKSNCINLYQSFGELGSFDTEMVADAQVARWKKLVWNIPFNGLSVLKNCETLELLETSSSRVVDLMREVVALASRVGVTIEDSFIEKMMSNTQKMASYAPSMLLDYRAGRPLELDAIYDRALRLAMVKNLDLPSISALRSELELKVKERAAALPI